MKVSDLGLWKWSSYLSTCYFLLFSINLLDTLTCDVSTDWNRYFAGMRAAGMRVAGMRAAGMQATGCIVIVYVKPKICNQCYFSYPPLPPAAYSNKKGKKEQCTIINTMCIVVKNLYAQYVQLSEPLNSLYTLATWSKLVPDKIDKISNQSW